MRSTNPQWPSHTHRNPPSGPWSRDHLPHLRQSHHNALEEEVKVVLLEIQPFSTSRGSGIARGPGQSVTVAGGGPGVAGAPEFHSSILRWVLNETLCQMVVQIKTQSSSQEIHSGLTQASGQDVDQFLKMQPPPPMQTLPQGTDVIIGQP